MQRSQSWIIPTVMSPEKGGPVYNQLRANFAYTRRMIQRRDGSCTRCGGAFI